MYLFKPLKLIKYLIANIVINNKVSVFLKTSQRYL